MKSLLAALALTCVVVAQADTTIYNNGGPNQVSGNEMTFWTQAEDFTLSADSVVQSIHFWDFESPNAPNDGLISWAIYSDGGGSPNALLAGATQAYTRTFTGNTGVAGFGDEYLNDVLIPDFNATAGTTYWLALHFNPTEGWASRDERYWETTNPNGTFTGHENEQGVSGFGFDNGQEHAFTLDGHGRVLTPEPFTMSLGIAGIGLFVRRRRANKA